MSEPSDGTSFEESRNIELVKEYMLIAYDPRRAGARAVSQLHVGAARVAAGRMPEPRRTGLKTRGLGHAREA
jgi:hypothetical protein